MTTELMILKGVLMYRRLGWKFQSKEDQREEKREWIRRGHLTPASIEEWVDRMRKDLPELTERNEEFDAEVEASLVEAGDDFWDDALRNDRDEWDDYWASRGVACVDF